MRIEYQIFEEENLLIQKFYGEWSLEFLKSSMKIIGSLPEIDRVDKILTDMRGIHVRANSDIINDIRILINNAKKRRFIHVHFTDDIHTSVLFVRFQQELTTTDRKYFYCNNLIKAIEKLNLNTTEKELEYKIQNLQNKI